MTKNLDIRHLAEQLVTSAGEALFKLQNTHSITTYKDRQDICTTADIAAEKIIIDGIKEKYPNHQIESEEAGTIGEKSSHRWIIDPLDGTKEYVRGIPQFNTSIAVEYNNELVASAIYRPTDHSLYSASLGEGAYHNGQQIHVSMQASLPDSFIYCYLPAYTRSPDRYEEAWKKLGNLGQKVYRLRSFADENSTLCWLAQGGHEGYLNLSNTPKWHDIAPGLLIAHEAGAYIEPDLISKIRSGQDTSIIITNNATIHQAIESIIRS